MQARQQDNAYLDEWRKRVDAELETSANAHQNAAIIQERMLGRLDDHDRRLKSLETSPEGVRSAFGTYGGCIGQLVFAVFSGVGALTGISGTVIAIIALIHR